MSIVEDYFAAYQRNDHDALDKLRQPNWTNEWPQTGERIRGAANDRLIHENYPGYPRIERGHVTAIEERWAVSPVNTLIRVLGEGSLWFCHGLNRYATGSTHTFIIIELRDGLVERETMYFPDPFDPPEWRREWVGELPEQDPDLPIAPASEGEVRRRREALDRFYRPSGSAEANRAAILAGLDDLFHADAVEDIPQSGERIAPLANIRRVIEAHPEFPKTTEIRRIIGTGNMFVVEQTLQYGDTTYVAATLLEFHGQTVAHATDFFAERTAAPAWRAAWVEKL